MAMKTKDIKTFLFGSKLATAGTIGLIIVVVLLLRNLFTG
jgi:hypothetical protein